MQNTKPDKEKYNIPSLGLSAFSYFFCTIESVFRVSKSRFDGFNKTSLDIIFNLK